MKPLASILSLMLLLCSSQGYAVDSDVAACYLPTQSDVSYTQLIDLPTSSPNELIHYGKKDIQFGELWLPGDGQIHDGQKAPLIIFIHGGCWLNQYDINHSHALSTALAQAGYAVWAIEYRRVGDQGGGWPSSLQDIEKAITYVAELTEYPIDLNKVALAGHSAGGHLALLAGANSSSIGDAGFKAVIGLAPIVDLAEYSKGGNSCQTAVSSFMGGSLLDRAAQYAKANPVEVGLPDNTLLIHGSVDSIVPPEQSDNRDVDLKVVEGAGHFDAIHPGTPAFQVLLRELAKVFK